jgi:predicted RNase H-like nuclease (RuvC/YqgF family)
LGEAEKYKDMLEQLSKENEELDAIINEMKQEKKNL